MTESGKPSDAFRVRLKEAREIRKLSQAELAARAGLPASSISHFEAGSRKPSFENLRRLAGALAVSTDFLLGRANDVEGNAQADPLYRDFKNLSDQDREMARLFMETLARKNRGGGGGP
jgi:transcriptional regulator with XRE-family HTH domain